MTADYVTDHVDSNSRFLISILVMQVGGPR